MRLSNKSISSSAASAIIPSWIKEIESMDCKKSSARWRTFGHVLTASILGSLRQLEVTVNHGHNDNDNDDKINKVKSLLSRAEYGVNEKQKTGARPQSRAMAMSREVQTSDAIHLERLPGGILCLSHHVTGKD